VIWTCGIKGATQGGLKDTALVGRSEPGVSLSRGGGELKLKSIGNVGGKNPELPGWRGGKKTGGDGKKKKKNAADTELPMVYEREPQTDKKRKGGGGGRGRNRRASL